MKQLIEKLANLADNLDSSGHKEEASQVDALLAKVANTTKGFTFNGKELKSVPDVVALLSSDPKLKSDLIAELKSHPAMQGDSFMKFLSGGSMVIPPQQIADFLAEKGFIEKTKTEESAVAQGLGAVKSLFTDTQLPTLEQLLGGAGYASDPSFSGGVGSLTNKGK